MLEQYLKKDVQTGPTEGLRNNTNGLLDIYIQNANPGKRKRIKLAAIPTRFVLPSLAHVTSRTADS